MSKKPLSAMDKEFNDDKYKAAELPELLIVTEDTSAPTYWDMLPYHLVLKVYGYLKDSDKVAMAQVCQSWYSCFKDATLWRIRKFQLEESNGRKILDFVSIFGRSLKSVRINCPEKKTIYACSCITETLENLTEKLENARLDRLEVVDSEVLKKTNKFKQTLTFCIKKLIKSQTDLKHFGLANLQLYGQQGTEVLKLLQDSSGNTLESLRLFDLFQTSERFYEQGLNLLKYELQHSDVEKFQNLQEISINFSYLTEEIIQQWTMDQKPNLERLVLYVVEKELRETVNLISNTTWKNLIKALPRVKVDLYMLHYFLETDKVAPEMPLNGLFMMSNQETDQDMELSSILRHLANNFNNKLECFVLFLPCLKDSVDNEIIRVLKECKKLTESSVPASAAIGVATVLSIDFKERPLRLLQFSKRRDDPMPSQDIVNAVNGMLSVNKNLKVEWVDKVLGIQA